jgi:hypothetical protein
MNKKYTNQEIIIMCDTIIENINQAKLKYQCVFLCDEVGNYLNVHRDVIINHIPEFTIENAIKHANARTPNNYDLGWWDGYEVDSAFNYQDRIKFMLWIKKQYKPSFYKWLLNICNRINF